MNKFLFASLFLLIFSQYVKSQDYDKNCYYGITFEVSKNPNWGYGELVITSVEANSPAEKAGVKVGDIIMEINSKATYLRDNQTIASWLFDDMYNPEVTFTIRNMNTYFKEYTLNRRCIAVNSVSEKELSEIFSFYSLENTTQRSFTLPLHVEINNEVDFTDYHSYDFYNPDKNIRAVDRQIIALLEKELQAKGLVHDTSNPDIVIQFYYNYEPNPQFNGLNDLNYAPRSWRYDNEKLQMVSLPIFDMKDSNKKTAAQYLVEYGFSFYDRKYIDESKLTQIWDCNIKDYLSSNYSLSEYIKFHTPLILRQFPYSVEQSKAQYIVDFNRYNYTGIYFDADDLMTVKDIDANSPAYIAGIRPGYVIQKINNKKLGCNTGELSNAYKQFISETMVFRDLSTRYTNAEGYTDCMLWDTKYSSEILKEFNKPHYFTHFSYLYDFERYIGNGNDKKITIEAWDGVQKRIFQVTPKIQKSVTVRVL